MTYRKETLLRILNLMQQGTVTPDEAAELIDALYETTPEATPTDDAHTNGANNPARGLLDQILRAAEDAMKATGQAVRSVNWQQIGQSMRQQTQRGLDELRKTLDELEKSDWDLRRWGKSETNFHQTMDLAIVGGQSLSIELPAGNIHLIGGFDGGRVEADIRLRGANPQHIEQAKATYSLTIEQTENGVRITAPELDGDLQQKVNLRLQLPRQVHLHARVEHKGNFEIEKLNGDLDLRTTHGDIHLRHIRGNAKLEAVHGDTQISDLQGERVQINLINGDAYLRDLKAERVAVHAANGDVETERADIRDLTVETVHGDISLDMRTPIQGEVRLTTVKGDITATLPDGNDCRIQMHTSAGEIECALECREVHKDKHHYTGVAGDGSGTLALETVHGDVRILLRAHTTA